MEAENKLSKKQQEKLEQVKKELIIN